MLYNLKRWEEAADAFRCAIQQQEETKSYERLGQVLLQLQQSEEAADAFQRALALGPETNALHHGLGSALFQQQRFEEAAVSYLRATQLDPQAARSHHSYGDAMFRLARWDEAIAAYRRTIELQPAFVSSHNNLANLLCKKGQLQDAEKEYRRILALKPESASAQHSLADILLQLNRRDEAVIAYERAIEIRPNFSASHLNLGNLFCSMAQWEQAAGAYRKAAEIDPDAFWPQHNLGNVLYQLQRWEEAAAALARATKINPAVSMTYHLLGDALLKLGRFEEASEAYRCADDLNPDWSRGDAGETAKQMERWLDEQASSVPADRPDAGASRFLFVLDGDYGELTTVMYLLLGQKLRHQSLLLLTPRLYLTNRESLPGRTRLYASMADIVETVEREKPEIVFLCSAYLFSIHKIMSLEELDKLVSAIRLQGAKIVIGDPFLGTLAGASHATISIDIPANAPEQLRRIKEEQDELLVQHFSASFQILRKTIHLYPAYPEFGDGERNISFFNPSLQNPFLASTEKPNWCFVLASRDYELQILHHGKDWFIDVLVAKLEQTQRAGRHAVFIGPYDCVQSVIAKLSVKDSVTLLTYCSFKRFSALLLSAEYAFYWNSVSHSMLLRLYNKAPVFQFDKGHLVRNVKHLYERVVGCYYQGWDPIYLNQEEELEPVKLAVLAGQYRSAAQDVVKRLKRSPTPAGMIRKIQHMAKATAGKTPARRRRMIEGIASRPPVAGKALS
jgi:tetratricopeptide (TPR) repeat protein